MHLGFPFKRVRIMNKLLKLSLGEKTLQIYVILYLVHILLHGVNETAEFFALQFWNYGKEFWQNKIKKSCDTVPGVKKIQKHRKCLRDMLSCVRMYILYAMRDYCAHGGTWKRFPWIFYLPSSPFAWPILDYVTTPWGCRGGGVE